MPLIGAGGEPISFERTIHSHGCARLAPAAIEGDRYVRTWRLGEHIARISLRERGGLLAIESERTLAAGERAQVLADVRAMFRFDDDLSPFYAAIKGDPQLAWARSGAGRMLSSPTVFEDVVKTICTTNCAWSATVRMTGALVERGGGAFPTPQRLTQTPPEWFKDVARMGYRGAYVRQIAVDVAARRLDLEALRPSQGLSDDVAEERLLALPGIGPYACAHVMMMLGRHRRLVLDSWTRPPYLRLTGKRRAGDRTIERAFRRYGAFAGLAFWLFLTRDWIAGA